MCLHVIDWRYIVRIANIDSVALAAGTLNLTKMLIDAQHKLFKQGVGRWIAGPGRRLERATVRTPGSGRTASRTFW